MMGWITDNLGLKLLSAAVAVLLWLASVGEPDMTTAAAVPVQYRNIPKNLEISSDLTDSAYVELRGPSTRLTGSSLANVIVMLDLGRERRPGERTFSILSENVTLPPGVEFLRAVPSQIQVRLEARVSRDLPVAVRYAGPPPEGFRLVSENIQPSVVRIVGPESRVSAIDNVQTDPVEIPAVEGETTIRVNAFAGDPHVRLDRSDALITVRLVLERNR
ncbi:MAG: YbbR-like domain-containing protein [Acidobacteria bacterium]|nr:YbbR-like domain-containing protein [Acidobacteriota bacterium]